MTFLIRLDQCAEIFQVFFNSNKKTDTNSLCVCQDVTKGFVQLLSKGEEEEEEVEEDNVDEEEVEEEEEDNDTLAETEAPSTSLDDPTEKSTETSQSAKLEELKEESVPDGEQRGDGAAEITEHLDTTGEDKTGDGIKAANGTADSNARSQSGSNKKLSLFRRLSSSRLKQTNDRDLTPTEGAILGDAVVRGEPPSSTTAAAAGSSQPETNRGRAQHRSDLASGARGPRSGACTVL
uniref:gelsolin-related protein of 125 kDa-like n=1 Tax=Epinephelus lanceolatus TaxID=310571 RepID=UPI001447B00D|nr:gelsolin-related protein of 125 kDa-like [Epinephelus lanceolatus]